MMPASILPLSSNNNEQPDLKKKKKSNTLYSLSKPQKIVVLFALLIILIMAIVIPVMIMVRPTSPIPNFNSIYLYLSKDWQSSDVDHFIQQINQLNQPSQKVSAVYAQYGQLTFASNQTEAIQLNLVPQYETALKKLSAYKLFALLKVEGNNLTATDEQILFQSQMIAQQVCALRPLVNGLILDFQQPLDNSMMPFLKYLQNVLTSTITYCATADRKDGVFLGLSLNENDITSDQLTNFVPTTFISYKLFDDAPMTSSTLQATTPQAYGSHLQDQLDKIRHLSLKSGTRFTLSIPAVGTSSLFSQANNIPGYPFASNASSTTDSYLSQAFQKISDSDLQFDTRFIGKSIYALQLQNNQNSVQLQPISALDDQNAIQQFQSNL